MSPALRPCPFCGGEAHREITVCDDTIRCTNPKCRATISCDTRIKRRGAPWRWNQRQEGA